MLAPTAATPIKPTIKSTWRTCFIKAGALPIGRCGAIDNFSGARESRIPARIMRSLESHHRALMGGVPKGDLGETVPMRLFSFARNSSATRWASMLSRMI